MNPERASQENKQFEFKYFPDPEQRRLLAYRTLELIYDIDKEQINHLLFLDKGARPLVTIFQDFWHKVHPEAPLPKIAFLQIGRETTSKFRDNIEYGNFTGSPEVITREYGDEIARIREEYTDLRDFSKIRERMEGKLEIEKRKMIANQEWDYNDLTQRVVDLALHPPQIMIVDDVAVSHETLHMAEQILRLAFPEIKERQISDFVFGYNLDSDDGLRTKLFTKEWESQGPTGAPWMHKPGVTGVTDKKDMLTAHSSHKAGFSKEAVNELRDEMHEIASEYGVEWQGMYKEINELRPKRGESEENDADWGRRGGSSYSY